MRTRGDEKTHGLKELEDEVAKSGQHSVASVEKANNRVAMSHEEAQGLHGRNKNAATTATTATSHCVRLSANGRESGKGVVGPEIGVEKADNEARLFVHSDSSVARDRMSVV